jgi:hypothetical protein
VREAIMRAQCHGHGITSSQEVDKYIAQRVGDPEEEHEVMWRSVNMAWGNEKELFAIEAMRRQLLKRPELQGILEGTILLETGFTPCQPDDYFGDMIRVGDEDYAVMCLVHRLMRLLPSHELNVSGTVWQSWKPNAKALSTSLLKAPEVLTSPM